MASTPSKIPMFGTKPRPTSSKSTPVSKDVRRDANAQKKRELTTPKADVRKTRLSGASSASSSPLVAAERATVSSPSLSSKATPSKLEKEYAVSQDLSIVYGSMHLCLTHDIMLLHMLFLSSLLTLVLLCCTVAYGDV